MLKIDHAISVERETLQSVVLLLLKLKSNLVIDTSRFGDIVMPDGVRHHQNN